MNLKKLKAWIKKERKDNYWSDNDEEGYMDRGKEVCLDSLEDFISCI